jgi:sulfate permease, SulP family
MLLRSRQELYRLRKISLRINTEAANIRAGARSPLSGIMHSGFLLLFMLVAAPLAGFVPLAALAGVLVVVCWNMAEKAEFARLLRQWQPAAGAARHLRGNLAQGPNLRILAGCLLAAVFALLRNPVAEEDE